MLLNFMYKLTYCPIYDTIYFNYSHIDVWRRERNGKPWSRVCWHAVLIPLWHMADAVGWGKQDLRMIFAANESRDARFCVSRRGICDYCQRFVEWVYWYWRNVRRKILRLYWGDMLLLTAVCWMSVLAWAGRETQDFASLLGWRRWVCDDGIKDDIRSLQK